MIWVMSIGFEVLERSLNQFLPNFSECWWDSLLLDLLGCNLLGILLGNYIIKKFKMQKYDWLCEGSGKQNFIQKLKTLFNPENHIKNNKWHWLASPMNFITVVWIVVFNLLNDLSNFVNKSALNLPSGHYLIIIRIFIIGMIGAQTTMELYSYIQIKHKEKKLTTGIILIHLIILLEATLFISKKPKDFFDPPTSFLTKLLWTIIGSSLLLLLNYSRICSYKKSQKSEF